MNKKIEMVRKSIEDIGKTYTPGLYQLMEETMPELKVRMEKLEDKINTLVKEGEVSELSKALDTYWFLHMDLISRSKNLKINHPTPI